MASVNSKNKGNRNENELAKILNERFGNGKKIFSRSPQSGAWGGGSNRELREDMDYQSKLTLASDIITPHNFKFIIEHKAYKQASFWDLFNSSSELNSWVKQVEDDSSWVDKEPMLIVKYNNKKRIVYIKQKIKGYVFEWNEWYCYWLDDLLKLDNKFFYED